MRWTILTCLILLFGLRYRAWTREQRALLEFCAEFSQTLRPVTLEGELVRSDRGEVRLEGATWITGLKRTPLPTQVIWREPEGSLDFGRRGRISGRLGCTRPLQNPGIREDGVPSFYRPVLILKSATYQPLAEEPAGLLARFRRGALELLRESAREYPSLRALVLAVWTGETLAMPERLIEHYRDTGLLPVLALSGQHVLIFSRVLLFLGGPLAFLIFLSGASAIRTRFYLARAFAPVIAVGILYVSSGGAASVRRTAGMVLFASLVRLRSLHCSPLQCALSSLGVMLLWSPHEVLSIGFVMSGVFASLTLAFLFLGRGEWVKGAIKRNLGMSILTFPITAFFFAKVALAAPITQLTVGMLWEFFWIPCGFLIPLAERCLPTVATTALLESLAWMWDRFVALQLEWLPVLARGCAVVVRPRWIEWVAIEGALILLFLPRKKDLS